MRHKNRQTIKKYIKNNIFNQERSKTNKNELKILFKRIRVISTYIFNQSASTKKPNAPVLNYTHDAVLPPSLLRRGVSI